MNKFQTTLDLYRFTNPIRLKEIIKIPGEELKFCLNPKTQIPLCPECERQICRAKIIINVDCGTCKLLNSDWKKDPCLSCACFDHHQPNWSVILEQNKIQKENEKAFCKGYYYLEDCWDCGWISCTNCRFYRVDCNGVDSCIRRLPMPNEEKIKTEFSTLIYGNCFGVVTPENQALHHKRVKEFLARQKKKKRKLKSR